jgi:hypothetical protein
MRAKNETKNQTDRCGQSKLDLQKLVDEIREKLKYGVELPDGNVVAVNLSVYHFTYAKMHDNKVEVIYATGCVSVHVNATIANGNVEINDVSLYNLCGDTYGV